MTRKELSEFILCSIRGKKTIKFKPFTNKTRGIFAVLSLLNETEEELTSGEIAKRLGLTTPRMAVALKTLCKKEYVKTAKSAQDGRKTIVLITDLGKEIYKRQFSQSVVYLDKLLSVLDDKDVSDLERIAKKLLV
jgi:DNA-binding MarR family transcriptional regulator